MAELAQKDVALLILRQELESAQSEAAAAAATAAQEQAAARAEAGRRQSEVEALRRQQARSEQVLAQSPGGAHTATSPPIGSCASATPSR
eukprot:COSAG01_NODE_34730_length_543_cov_0.635135_1_plen_90_part_00